MGGQQMSAQFSCQASTPFASYFCTLVYTFRMGEKLGRSH